MFNKQKFLQFYPGSQSASDCFDAVYKALGDAGILTELTLIGCMATIRTEVGRAFKPIQEYGNGSAYENRHDLGNYCPGGRANYTAYGKALRIDLVCHPELALDTIVSAKILVQYFKDHNIPLYCGLKDWTTVRKLVNGGSNGLDLFISVINQYNG